MWTLIFSLLFMQQAEHTDVRLQMERFPGFHSEAACVAAGERMNMTFDTKAIEQHDDFQADDDKPQEPDKDKFKLMRPFYTCIEIK